MKESLDLRLSELKKEFESGQKMLSELEDKSTNLKHSLLRISGAIQVLEELLKENKQSAPANVQELDVVGSTS